MELESSSHALLSSVDRLAALGAFGVLNWLERHFELVVWPGKKKHSELIISEKKVKSKTKLIFSPRDVAISEILLLSN